MKVLMRALGVATFAGLVICATAHAQGMWGGMGPGPGPMMGGGPGMMPGEPGDHGGPAMMGWGGPGWSDPGMMGRGAGMMPFGYRMQQALGLSEEQRKKLDAIHDDLQAKTWDIIGKMRSEMVKMRELMAGDPLDKAALDAAFQRMNDLRLQRFDAGLAAHDQMLTVLTKEQRDQLKRSGPWWMHPAG